METINRLLQSVGHRCFRNGYETAIRCGEAFDIADLLRRDPQRGVYSPTPAFFPEGRASAYANLSA